MTLCEKGCFFIKYNNNTNKITCQCNYKYNTDYKIAEFEKNFVDEKFGKKKLFENLQSMKCISKIFKLENLKKNPGFFIMIFFLLLFVISAILYFTLGECLKIKKLINEIDSQQNLFDKPNENNEINNKIKREDEKVDNNNVDNKGNKINTKSLIIQVKNKNISSNNRKSDKDNVIIKNIFLKIYNQ